MAATTKGTAHLFGIAAGTSAITNATVQSFSITYNHANVSETLNEEGNKIEDRRDDLRGSGQIVVKIKSGYSDPTPGTVLTYDSVKYYVTSVDRSETNGDFQTLTLSIETWEKISLS